MGVGVDFVLAITFKPVFIFEFRFHLWSIFFLFIAYIQISAIFKTITCQAIIGSIDKMAIMAAMTCVYLAIKRANIGVYVKSRKNVDPHWKRNWKICISFKVMAKAKLTSKLARAVGVPVGRRSDGRLATMWKSTKNVFIFFFFPVFFPVFFFPRFSPPSSPFLIEGVLGSKNLFSKSDSQWART